MVYSRNECEMIYNGMRKIEEWIKKNVTPNVRDDIVIGFGGIVRRGYYNDIKEQKYELCITNEHIIGHIGGLRLIFPDMDDWHIESYSPFTVKMYKGRGGSYDVEFAASLIENWAMVKSSICNKLDEQISKIEKISNFVV